jgi:hypothetical protein
MELGEVNRIRRVERRKWEQPCRRDRQKEFEEFAADCVNLGEQADTPEQQAGYQNPYFR